MERIPGPDVVRSRMTKPGGLESHHACNHCHILPPCRHRLLRVNLSEFIPQAQGTRISVYLSRSSSQTSSGDRSAWLSYRIAGDQVSAACISKSLLYTQLYTCKIRMQNENTLSQDVYKVHRPTTRNPRAHGTRSLEFHATSPSHLTDQLHPTTLPSHANYTLWPSIPSRRRHSQLLHRTHAPVASHLPNERVSAAHPGELAGDGCRACDLRFDPFYPCRGLTRPKRPRSAQLRRTDRG